MDTAIALISGKTVKPVNANRTAQYVCPDCRFGVYPRDGGKKAPHFAHLQGAPLNCPSLTTGMSKNQLASMTRAILRMQIVMVNGRPEVLYAVTEQTPPRRLDEGHESHRSSQRRKLGGVGDAKTHPSVQLPELVGALVFVRHLGGAYRGHDHRTVPVCWGDELIVLAGNESIGLAGARRLPKVRIRGSRWYGWEVTLPTAPTDSYVRWLGIVGILVEAPGGRSRLITPPVAYRDSEPIYPGTMPVTVLTGASMARTVAVDRKRRARGGPNLAPRLLHELLPSTQTGRVNVLDDQPRTPALTFSIDHSASSAVPAPWTVSISDGVVGDPLHRPRITGAVNSHIVVESTAADEFSITAENTDSTIERLLCASADEANSWIAQRTKQFHSLTVSGSGPGHVVVQFARPDGPASGSSPALVTRDRDNQWQKAFAAATHRTGMLRQHWQVRDRTHAGSQYRRNHV